VDIIVQKEATLLVGECRNGFYEAILSSDDSISKLVRRHKPDNADKSQVTISLLLYRLVDVIAFVRGHELSQSHSTVKRQ
jgi:hypothetical protein